MGRGAQAYSPAHELGPRKAVLARQNYAKSSMPNCRYLGLLGLRNASAHHFGFGFRLDKNTLSSAVM